MKHYSMLQRTCFGVTAAAFAFGLLSVNAEAAEPKLISQSPAAAAVNLAGPKLKVPPPAIYCADPSVTAINFAIVTRTTPFTGRVRITAVARNLGRDLFEVGILALYKQVPGRAYAEVAHVDVPRLAPGAQVTVSFDEPRWSASDEFPPTYKAIFILDPDAALGSRPSHRDCNVNNNQMERSGTEINFLFR